MGLNKQRLNIIIAGLAAILAAGVYIFLYAPLIKEIKSARIEAKRSEKELDSAREQIALAKEQGLERSLMKEEEASILIEELTKASKPRGVDFVSITPGEIETPKEGFCRILPLDLEIESSYEELGAFLRLYNEGLKNYLVKVKSFSIVPFEKYPEKLKISLTVNIYLTP